MNISSKKVNNCRLNRMHSYVAACIAVLMLFSECDCRHHLRSYLLRRQNEQVSQNPNPMMQYFNPVQQTSSFPQPVGPNSGYAPLPYYGMPPMFNYTPGPTAYSAYNPSPAPYIQPAVTTSPLLPSPQYQNSYSQISSQYQNQPAVSVRRRKKNVSDKKNAEDKLLEKGKKILEKHPMDSGKEIPNNSLGDSYEIDGNATIIPIPKGVQVKTFSDHDENRVKQVVNISSTQRTLSGDNNTEIENVVEMQMEKKLEDEKGDNKESEEVRIVETELLKPFVKMRSNNITQGKRHRRFHPWKFSLHRRSKRSEKDPEVMRSPSIYNKIAKRCLSNLKRKYRMVERNSLLNRQETSDSVRSEFGSIKNKVKEMSGKPTKDDSLIDNDELGEFLKHFLDELKKFKRIRENIGNKAQHMEFSNASGNWYNFKQAKHEKKNRHREYPEHMKIVMNLNMTLDTKTKDHLVRSPNAPLKSRNYDVNLETTVKPVELTTHQMALKVLFINDGKEKDAKILTVMLLLSGMIFLLPILVWIYPKLYRTQRLVPRSSAARTYRLYHECGYEKARELENFRRQNICAEELPQLEWQSESGDWLCEKEMDFK